MIASRTSLRVALVRPPVLQLAKSLSSYGAILPIGLAYVAASLRDAGHVLQVIDAAGEALDRFVEVPSPIGPLLSNGLQPDEIVEHLDAETQVLGITHMFLHEWPTVREIAERAKRRLPNLIVVLGGENPTAFWRWILDSTDAVDYCVLGEGEATMVELVARLRDGRGVDDLHGIATRAGVSTGLSPRSTDIDTIPWPAWEFFPVERYMECADNHGVNRGRSMPMLATRGCPYRCTFCSSPDMWTTKYVTRDPRAVVDEIRAYVERYHVNNVNFCDLTAIVKREWIVEFCGILREERLDLTWQLPTGTRTEVMDAEVVQLLYETGCRNITYAPESGSERMLQVIKKKVQLVRMLESLRAARRAGLVTRVNIIIGHPQEQWADTWKSLRFLVRAALAGCNDAAVMIFAPYPGSADFQDLLQRGMVQFSPDYHYLALARSGFSSKTYNPRMTTRQLILSQFGMLLVFYAVAYLSRPWRALGVAWSLLTGRESTQLDQLLRTKLRQARGGRRSSPAAAHEPQRVAV
jgi:hypothetical protein